MNVYKAINAVQKALSVDGIGKTRTNTQGAGYKFRGIDDVYNAISPMLAEHGLCIIPRMLTRTCEERQSKAGGALFYVTVEAEFDFVSALDGTHHTARTFGEAMDSGDKATNKAMSAAYKYAAFQTFAIPTEGNPDADSETHEVAHVKTAPKKTGAMADVMAGIPELSPEDKSYFNELAENVKDLFASKGASVAFDRVKAEELDSEQTLHLWSRLDSKVRSALKVEGGLRNGAA